MTDSQKLLAEYAADGSERAFRELVDRYINFVYSTARRLVGENAYLADDVTQNVFINLARKAPTFSSGVLLGGWLHQHTYHLATKAVRNERRRQSREREAVEMNTLQDHSEAHLRNVEPILDEAITQLGSADRMAILLRFFEQRDFRSVGEALGSNEDAARMRVKRALEKLQVLLKHRGVTLSVVALGGVLTKGAVMAAPAGLAGAASSLALASAGAKTGNTFALLKPTVTTQLKSGITILFIAGLLATAVIYQRSQLSPRENGRSVRPQAAQRSAPDADVLNRFGQATLPGVPVPRMQPAVRADAAPPEPLRGNMAAWFESKASKLTLAQVEPYLEANQRSAASLLAAFRSTDNPALLAEAMQKYPKDPLVAFEALLGKDLPSGDRRQWLEALKQSAPENALANYLSAADLFKAGQTDQAVQELLSASGKPGFKDYFSDRVQADEQAYLAAGRSEGEAKLAATYNLRLPHLGEVQGLARTLVDLANSYQQAGDEASRQAALQMAVDMGRRFANAPIEDSLMRQLVGIAVERTALTAMDPQSPYGAPNQTVQDRIDQLTEQRGSIQQLSKQAENIWPTLSDQDLASYLQRAQTLGEQRALNWLVTTHGQK